MIMRRRQRPSWFQRYKKYVYVSSGVLAVGVISFAVTVKVFEDKQNNYDKKENIKEYSYITDDSSIRINPESINRVEVEEKKEEIKVVQHEEVKVAEKKEEKKEIKASVEVSAKPVKKELTFIWPLEGENVLEYAKDKLVYSETLKEWITHTGVDIKGEEAVPIKASADGKIKDKKVDPRYGNTIIIEHSDGYKTIYSNLSTLDLIEINQEIKQGEIISGVGAGYGFEAEEGPHIHFEIIRDGENINPAIPIGDSPQ